MLKVFSDGVFGDSWGDSGPTVLYLHGWRRSHHDAQPLAEELERRGYRTVALDLPGFGASPLPQHHEGARRYALELAALRDEIQPDLVIGHSFGGRIAACWAASRDTPTLLTGAPLLHRHGRSSSPLAYRLIRRAAHWKLIPPAHLEAARQKYGSADYRAATGIQRDILVSTIAESYESEIARWSAQVTLWWGETDSDVPLDVAQRASSLAPVPPRLVIEPGAGHLAPISHPHALADLISRDLLPC